jgi:hypothetical protein
MADIGRMPHRTTTCDHCRGSVDLIADTVLETRVIRYLECGHCQEKLVRLKPASDLHADGSDAAP